MPPPRPPDSTRPCSWPSHPGDLPARRGHVLFGQRGAPADLARQSEQRFIASTAFIRRDALMSVDVMGSVVWLYPICSGTPRSYLASGGQASAAAPFRVVLALGGTRRDDILGHDGVRASRR